MRSVLEFLKVTEALVNDNENIGKAAYASATVVRLKSYRARLQQYFNEHPDEKAGINLLLEQANAQAMQLEFYLSRVDSQYYDKRKLRLNIDALFQASRKVMCDIRENPDKFDQYQLTNFVELNNYIYHLYANSKFYVFDVSDKDRLKMKEMKSFLEGYDHGCYIDICCN